MGPDNGGINQEVRVGRRLQQHLESSLPCFWDNLILLDPDQLRNFAQCPGLLRMVKSFRIHVVRGSFFGLPDARRRW